MNPPSPEFLKSIITGALWIAGVLGVLFYWIRKSEDPPQVLIFKWAVSAMLIVGWFLVADKFIGGGGLMFGKATAFVVAGMTAAIGLILACIWGSAISSLFARPFTSLFEGGAQSEAVPVYAIAQARRKRGRYQGAISEIRVQLSKFPKDTKGRHLLAEILAEDLHDLDSAEECIEEMLIIPGVKPSAVSYGLNRLADWQLKQSHNTEAARQSLQRIVDLCPGTKMEQMAIQRLAHLDGQADMIEKKECQEAVALPEFNLELMNRQKRQGPVRVGPVHQSPEDNLRELEKHLQKFPRDIDAREQCIRICIHDLAYREGVEEHLEFLLTYKGAGRKELVRWWNLRVDFCIKLLKDIGKARETLQGIIDDFPDSAASENAAKRKATLRLEMNSDSTSRVVPLGSYEKLKGYQRPRSRGIQID